MGSQPSLLQSSTESLETVSSVALPKKVKQQVLGCEWSRVGRQGSQYFDPP